VFCAHTCTTYAAANCCANSEKIQEIFTAKAVTSHAGKEKLASICMFFMVVGEQVKKIDKLTKGDLLSKFPNIEWQRIITFRNRVAHEYMNIDEEKVFDICSNEIEPLLKTVKHIIAELEDNP
jgi:uncharacterized protein with HEPN domain